MKTISLLLLTVSTGEAVTGKEEFLNGSAGYLTGAILALIILGYLVYTLFKPEKF